MIIIFGVLNMKAYHWWFIAFGIIMISLLSKPGSWWDNPELLVGWINIHPSWAIVTLIGGCIAFYLDYKKK